MMLYTWTSPDEPTDRVYLFTDPRTALAFAPDAGRALYVAAVRYDEGGRCLLPTRGGVAAMGPRWRPPARADAHGTIIARGPIPPELYEGPVEPPMTCRHGSRDDRPASGRPVRAAYRP